jgi:hypothetical protein
MPQAVAVVVRDLPYWFVIGGQAVRCFCPYRPSRDVDFGVERRKDAEALLRRLRQRGHVELLERSDDTVHLSFDGIDVSIFVLPTLCRFTEGQALTLTGLFATKLHAILDRGTRRDFFDLYVLMHTHQVGVVECVRALSEVYSTDVNEGLILRALTYFDDAEHEAPLPAEGPRDWMNVKEFFMARAGALLLPPDRELDVQSAAVPSRDRSRKTPGEGPRQRRAKRPKTRR